MIYKSHRIKGHGRGKLLGFPTINLEIPANWSLEEGIYAVWVMINDQPFPGAMHYGVVPTFGITSQSLEIFLLNTPKENIPNLDKYEVYIEPVAKLRDILYFENHEQLIGQMELDVEHARAILATTKNNEP